MQQFFGWMMLLVFDTFFVEPKFEVLLEEDYHPSSCRG
jgi:hypothetical protein